MYVIEFAIFSTHRTSLMTTRVTVMWDIMEVIVSWKSTSACLVPV